MAKKSSKAAKKAKASKKMPRGAKASRAAKTARGAKKKTAAKRRGPRVAAKTTARKPTRKAPAKAARKAKAKSPAPRPARTTAETAAVANGKRPNLDRERRTIREEEMVPSPPSSLNMDRTASAARTGRAEFEQRLREHTSTGPAMTGGDVDADWEDAEAVGDEAPGGDNPTPDQDIVDEIGRAMGVEYDDDQELQGGDELAERDRHRWELDPASKDDFDEE
jgi:hypothetical protein